jgi:hypothetical protein
MMATCPICGSDATTLDKTGDATGFDCPRHAKFKVASSVFAQLSTKNATPAQWERALQKARARAGPDAWAPLIQTFDFNMRAGNVGPGPEQTCRRHLARGRK